MPEQSTSIEYGRGADTNLTMPLLLAAQRVLKILPQTDNPLSTIKIHNPNSTDNGHSFKVSFHGGDHRTAATSYANQALPHVAGTLTPRRHHQPQEARARLGWRSSSVTGMLRTFEEAEAAQLQRNLEEDGYI